MACFACEHPLQKLTWHSLLQDLIDCDVLLQKDDSLIGRVLDVYDGTGSRVAATWNASHTAPFCWLT